MGRCGVSAAAVVVSGGGHGWGCRLAGVLNLLGAGGEQQQGGGDQAPGGELRQPQPRQRGCGDAAQPRCGFYQDGAGEDQPGHPGDQADRGDRQGSVIRAGQRPPHVGQRGQLIRQRVSSDFDQDDGQADEDADDQHRGQRPSEQPPERCHRSTPFTARTIRDSAEPVTGSRSIPMMPRNLVW